MLAERKAGEGTFRDRDKAGDYKGTTKRGQRRTSDYRKAVHPQPPEDAKTVISQVGKRHGAWGRRKFTYLITTMGHGMGSAFILHGLMKSCRGQPCCFKPSCIDLIARPSDLSIL